MELDITDTQPKEGFVEACIIKFPSDYVGKWQYHQKGFNEHLEFIGRGTLTIEFSNFHRLSERILTLGAKDSAKLNMPYLLVHRIKSGFDGAEIRASFMEEYNPEREPQFDTEEEAFCSLGRHLVEEFKPRRIDDDIQ
jgi:hypothetical protein